MPATERTPYDDHRVLGQYFAAQQLLTRLPCPSWTPWQPDALARSTAWFPLVGLVVGVLTAVVAALAGGLFHMAPTVVAVIAVGVPVIVTGFFHEDAWADVCDAFGAATPDRRREIMRDSRVGSFGATGVALLLLGKFAGLSTLPWRAVLPVVVCAHIVSRWSSVVMMRMIRTSAVPLSSDNTASVASPYVGRVTVRHLLFASLVPTGPLCVWVFGPIVASGLLVGVVVVVVVAGRFFARFLGGVTGDCLGAVNQFVELGVYLMAGQPTILRLLRYG